jgi:hypothetical protein
VSELVAQPNTPITIENVRIADNTFFFIKYLSQYKTKTYYYILYRMIMILQTIFTVIMRIKYKLSEYGANSYGIVQSKEGDFN